MMSDEIEERIISVPQISWRIFLWEVFLFSLTLGLGIITAFRANEILKIQKLSTPQISFLELALNFILSTLFILLIIRFIKFQKGKRIIFKILFSLATFLGGGAVLNVWLPDIFALLIMFFLILWWFKKPSILNQDLCLILGIAGAGGILGLSLQPSTMIILLIIFSIYDFIAVYKTKHMVKMAKEMIESGAILALVIPQSFPGLKKNLEGVKAGGEFLILGGGDIAFPLMFCSSLIPLGILKTLIVALFSLIGLFASFYFFISQKSRQPIPALPPIALFSIIGYLITLLF